MSGAEYRFPDVVDGVKWSENKDRAWAFLSANGIDKARVPAGSVFVVDGDTLTVAEFVVDVQGRREICECKCGCAAPGTIITHGYRTQAVTYPLASAPGLYGFIPRRVLL